MVKLSKKKRWVWPVRHQGWLTLPPMNFSFDKPDGVVLGATLASIE